MDAEKVFNEVGRFLSGNQSSSMFGVACFKIGRKPFIMFYDSQIVCKLSGSIHEEACQLAGTSLFNPKRNDKPMVNWVQIPYVYMERWAYFARFAYEQVEGE